ncbi:MAG: YgfZ/GcvT domain-containing protein [Planctomycetota bacterium]
MADLTTLLTRLGARFRGASDPSDFGDPAAELREAESTFVAGLLPWEGLVRVGGTEAVAFLQRLLSCDLRDLAPGGSTAGCLLSPTGRALAVVLALRTEEEVFLAVETSFARPLAQALERYRFAEAVEIADRSESASWLVLLGPKAPDALRAVGIVEPAARGSHSPLPTSERDGRILRADFLGVPEFRLLASREQTAPLLERLLASARGGKPIGTVALEHLRIRAGLPRPGIDLDDSVYPEEVGLEAALSTSKGCYPGQEVVAKIRTYGGAKRRLVVLRFETGARPSRGDPVEADGAEVGRVTSASADVGLALPLALAIVRREALAGSAEIRVGGREGPLRAAVVPFNEGGRTGLPSRDARAD